MAGLRGVLAYLPAFPPLPLPLPPPVAPRKEAGMRCCTLMRCPDIKVIWATGLAFLGGQGDFGGVGRVFVEGGMVVEVYRVCRV